MVKSRIIRADESFFKEIEAFRNKLAKQGIRISKTEASRILIEDYKNIKCGVKREKFRNFRL